MIVNIFLIKNLEDKIIFFAPFEDLDSFIEVQLKESDLTNETKFLIENGNTIFPKYKFTVDTTLCIFKNMKISHMINWKNTSSLHFELIQKNINPYNLKTFDNELENTLAFLFINKKDTDELVFFKNINNNQLHNVKIHNSIISISDIQYLLKHDPYFKIEGEYAIFKNLNPEKYLYEKLESISILKEFFYL